MKQLTLLLSLLLFALFSCSEPASDKKDLSLSEDTLSTVATDTLQEGRPVDVEELQRKKEYEGNLLKPKSTVIGAYTLVYGYVKYDEDIYGWKNPGILEIYKKDKLIFSDSIKGYDELFAVSMGQHKLSGNKLIFTIDYGTQACDYTNVSRFYYIADNDQVRFIAEYSTASGDYAAVGFDPVFPEDSNGVNNGLLIVESMYYKEHDQPDKHDTTYIEFDKLNFTIHKLSHHIKD